MRRAWRKLHLGINAGTRKIVASLPTTNGVDDGSQVDPLLDQVEDPLASFTADDAYDREGAASSLIARHFKAAIIVPPRTTEAAIDTAETLPT